MSAVQVEVREVTKVYRIGHTEVRAVDDVSFMIEEGEFTAIMGPSGSGKSTLMHLVGCLDVPDSGSYQLEGVEVSSMRPSELARIRGRRIGFVFQNFNLIPRLAALENVELPLAYAGVPRRQRRQRATAMLERVGLGHRAEHSSAELSGGQRQLAAIARALINDPALLLADEPTGNLDSVTSQHIMELFTTLNREGITIILVTHDPDTAAYARRIIRLRDGQITGDERR